MFFELFDEVHYLVERNHQMEIDKSRLIEEIRKRPVLWDFRNYYASRNNKKIDELWKEIAKILETEVSSSKISWQKLRTAFFNEVKRIPMRIAKAKRKGTYDPSKSYNVWPYFDAIKFIALGRSVRGINNQCLMIKSDIKIIKSDNSQQKQVQTEEKFETDNLASKSNQTSKKTISADTALERKNFNSSETNNISTFEQKLPINNLFIKEEPKDELALAKCITGNIDINGSISKSELSACTDISEPLLKPKQELRTAKYTTENVDISCLIIKPETNDYNESSELLFKPKNENEEHTTHNVDISRLVVKPQTNICKDNSKLTREKDNNSLVKPKPKLDKCQLTKKSGDTSRYSSNLKLSTCNGSYSAENVNITGLTPKPIDKLKNAKYTTDNVDISRLVSKPELMGVNGIPKTLVTGQDECVKKNSLELLKEDIYKSLDTSVQDYMFLCSIFTRIKRMSALQKLQFRANMSSLMLEIFTSSTPPKDVDKRVLLAEDNDPDKKFLISFLPFLKSMDSYQNLLFRGKVVNIMANILSSTSSVNV